MMIAGTPWFFLFKDKITTDLMNALRPDVGVRIILLLLLFLFSLIKYNFTNYLIFFGNVTVDIFAIILERYTNKIS